MPMREVARAEGDRGAFGQSPFAIARGRAFERGLLKEGAKSLLEGLEREGVLGVGASGVVDLRLRLNGGPRPSIEDALAATEAHLRASATERGRPTEALLIGAALRLPGDIMFPEAILILDAVAVRRADTPVRLVVGEIKTYPDRGGYTDAIELSTARAQAGVYGMALRTVVSSWGIQDRIHVADRGFLVLSRPGSNQPSIRANEDLRYQMERAAYGFERLRAIAAGTRRPLAPETAVDAVQKAKIRYGDGCVSFCERAGLCSDRAFREGDPAALGDEMAHWLGSVTLHRALELLAGAKPSNVAEQDLLARVAEAGGSS